MASSKEARATSNPPASPGVTVTEGEEDTKKPALEAETDAEDIEDIEDGEEKEEVGASNKDKNWVESHNGAIEPSTSDGTADAPPLPDEAPPLPAEAPPGATEKDDGWAPVWEESAQAFYFYNRFTNATQWSNPRVPDATAATAQPGSPGVSAPDVSTSTSPPPPAAITGYNPAIHGDYDPNAWYAQPAAREEAAGGPPGDGGPADPNAAYAATAAFNRFTGRFQNSEITPENYNDENKSKRQMNAFFDVDAAANSHDGRSLKAERSGKKLTKTELKQFKEKRKAKKEEKRRAWLRD
ncbi:hypothetical protein BJ875DRAFT_478219 [Amylocarpus encephaloides]|uniref:WW domain-containing protein n=1 Tax=Amylocarpus encephaloides TaxID=45428 RepID=A0A9P8BZI1_9HELO|nr:hypothetical protein BJ875DRAFT_478219 [Amylocarpus encephaloides]